MDNQSINFYIDGIKCSGCEDKIKKAFKEEFGVECEIDLQQKKVRVPSQSHSPVEYKKCLDRLNFDVLKISTRD